MKYDHVVNYNGVYYRAGEEVPIPAPEEKTAPEEDFSDTEITLETDPHVYTDEELREMPVREIRQLAQDMGITLTRTIKDDVIKEFLEKQRR